MNVLALEIPDVLVITPTKHGDDRGFFSETYRRDVLAGAGCDVEFVQENHVFSAAQGVLRGLHYQLPPHAQGKLVRCVRGAILDVAVDIRKGSPTFGRHVMAEISAKNWQQIWVPTGFAHGYVTLEPNTEVIYRVTDYYAPVFDRGIAWNDPALGIRWPLAPDEDLLSPKDRRQPLLADAELPFQY